jgi:hypothetical protein
VIDIGPFRARNGIALRCEDQTPPEIVVALKHRVRARDRISRGEDIAFDLEQRGQLVQIVALRKATITAFAVSFTRWRRISSR